MTDDAPSSPRRRRWPWVALATVALLAALMTGAAWWTLRTDSGQRWVMDHVPGLQIENRQGRPDGGPFSAARVQWEGGGLRIVVHDLSWQDADWAWRPHPGTWVSVALQAPRARLVEVFQQARPDSDAPTTPPQDLSLPFALTLRQLHIGQINWGGQPMLAKLAGDVHVGDQKGTSHRARLEAQYQHYRLQMRGSMEAGAPLQTEGRLALATPADASQPWQAQAQWQGPLAKPSVTMQLALQDEQVLTTRSTLTPFAPWPLASLDASSQKLDLSKFHPGLPATSLTGSATVRSGAERGTSAHLSAVLSLDNALAGPWDSGTLPVQQLRLSAQDEAGALVITDLSALLHGDQQAGQIQGTGQWKGDTLSLALELSDLRLGAISPQAPAMALDGTAKLSLQGLPSPPHAVADDSTPKPFSGEADIDLAGELPSRNGARKTPVQLKTHAAFSTEGGPQNQTLSLRLAPLSLAAGPASAEAEATLTRDAAQGWRVVSQGRLASFDPSIWWAGPAGTDWRRLRHDLNGGWEADVQVLPQPTAVPPATSLQASPTPSPVASWLATLRGQGRFDLKHSIFAGVPLKGQGNVDADDTAMQLSAALHAASNRVEADLRWVHGGEPKWSGQVAAPALSALAPWQRLAPVIAQWLPAAGSLHAKASGQGRWPDFKTSGDLRAQGLVSGRWRAAQARASWQADLSRPNAPLSMNLEATRVHVPGVSIPHAMLTTKGTLAAHRLEVDAQATQRPADDAQKMAQASTQRPPRTDAMRLALQGRWAPGDGCAGTWRGTVDRIVVWPVRRQDEPWLDAKKLQATVQTTQPCGIARASLAPNQLQILGSTLRWQTAELVAAHAQAPLALRLDARLLPVRVARLLDRFGQDERIQGDLEISGRILLKSEAGSTEADIELARTGGDLAIQQKARHFALGLRSLRIAATARKGVWQLTQLVEGKAIGTLRGTQTIRMTQPGLLPGPQAALSGTMAMKLQQLGVWSAWIPPPWRMDGQLTANVTLAGTLGSPDYRGRLEGSELAVRNVLEGIQLQDGELALALQGQQATLEKLRFRGGDGVLTAKGSASFGAEPQARLRITADKLLAVGRVDRRIVLSGQSAIALNANRVAIEGRFTVDEGLIDITQASAPQLDEDVVIRPRPGQAPASSHRSDAQSTEASGEGFEQLDMALRIDLGQALRLTGRGIQTLLQGELLITAPEGELAVHGTVRTEGGRYAAYGQNLSIERGVVRFDGDLETPTLDVLALRPDLDMRVGVSITGLAADPRVRLYSEPDMSDIDKLSWLVMGRASEGLGQDDTALLQRAALALLAGDKQRSSTGLVQRLGLDELSLARGASGDLRDTVVTVGKQLSERWQIGYAQGLNAASGSWQLIYRVARQFTVRLSAGIDSAVDVVKTWRFDGRTPQKKDKK